MPVVRTAVQLAADPRECLDGDGELLARARAAGAPLLRIASWPGDVLLIGRYHMAPAEPAGVQRRYSGGRAAPAGAGFVEVSLALPHRSALASDDPYALRAEQTLNRAVRGVMGGLELLGLEPYYPGRDLLTVGGKPIAWLSLAVEDGGATLVEIGLSVERDLATLPGLADRLDPAGVVPVTMWQPDDVTSVARERGRTSPLEEVAAAIVEGYRRRLGFEIVTEEVSGPPAGGAGTPPFVAPATDLRCGRRAIRLGTLLAWVQVDATGRLAAVRLGGDVIAPAATVAALEAALVGPAAGAELAARLAAVLARPEHFLLGATADEVIDAVLAGAGR